MRLRRIRIEQFRKFAAPIEIDGLEDGLNILHGPNEAGKSTIAQALRTLFFERHNTRGDFVQAIAPAGEGDAAPAIEADFTLAGETATVAKTFFRKPRAQLTIGKSRWEGSAADEQLAERLGFALSGRGTSREDTHGIPGLLWIEQGASVNLDAPVAYAAQPLEQRLKGILGEVTSSAGGRLAQVLDAELKQLTRAGTKSPGALVDAARRLEQASQQQAGLQARADDYRALADGLARRLAELARLENDRPWEAYERQKTEAEGRRAALEPRQRALEADRQRLREIKARIDSLHAQDTARAKDLHGLAAQRGQLADAAVAHQQASAALAQAVARRTTTRAVLHAAREQLAAAERAQQRAALAGELERIRADIERIGKILARAGQFGQSIAALREQAAATDVPQADLRRLAELDQALRERRIQRDAIATRISYRLAAQQRIDGGPLGNLEGEGSQRISAPVTLRIAGVGEIDIAPGGEDIARLVEAVDRLGRDLAARCARLGVADYADAQARSARHQEIGQQIALQEKERETLLDGRSESEWRDRLADAQGQLHEREARLAELPEGGAQRPLEQARRACDDAERAATAADAQHDAHRQAVLAAQLAREKLQSAVDAESRRLDSEQARAAAAQRSRELAEAVASRDRLEEEVTVATTALADSRPELIEADIERGKLALASVERQRRDLREAIGSTRARLETLGAEGIDEQLAQTTATVENLARRVAQYQLRADALALLKERLAVHQEAAIQRLYAPLRERLRHYLEILFPGTPLGIGVDGLRPTRLERGGAELELREHSHGTREQLGVIARFAYADLLRDAGQPTLLILDDALVHSDANRRQQMKRILYDAALRHQILLFTCHPEDWRDAGARVMIDVAACQVGEA